MNESRTATRIPGRWWVAGMLLGICLLAGCRTLQTPFDDYFAKRREQELDRMANADGIRGPLSRGLFNRNKDRNQSLTPAAGRDDYDKAERTFKNGQYAEAEKAAKAIAKKYRGSPVREDALFLKAESQFAQKQYSWAQDSYGELVKEFPNTRYLEKRNKRLFAIAKYWLREPEYVTSDDVKLVGHKEGGKARVNVRAQSKSQPFDITRTVPILPNLWDRSRPVFDTEGRALQALRSIWTSDATGSLADDALMLSASYHLRSRNYLEADHLLTLLREEYPKSPHNQNAHLLSGFVKHASYQGPKFDDRTLDAAKHLKKNSLNLYPKGGHADRLRDDLRKIAEQKASGDWATVQFYLRKNKQHSASIYCREIIRLYPQTSYADRARKLLKTLKAPPPASPKPDTLRKPKWPLQMPSVKFPQLPRIALPSWGGEPKRLPNEDPDPNRDPNRT